MAGPGGREVGRVNVRVLPNTDVFGRSLNRYLDRLERSLRIEIPTEIDSGGVAAEAKAAAAAAEAAAGEVEIPVVADKRKARDSINDVAQLFRNLGTLAKPALFTSAIPAIAGLGAAAVQAAGAVALIPAAAGAAAAGIGAMKLATAGFGEAMSNLGDPAAFAEALQTLAPAARATAIAVRDLAPAWSEMQQAVQQSFFQDLSGVVQDLGATYIPVLREQLSATAAAMGDMAQYAGQALLDPATVAAVNTMLAESASAFQSLAPAAGSFVSAFAAIGQVGAGFLPDMATQVRLVADEFAAWATSAEGMRTIEQVIRSALDALSQLGSIAANVGSALLGIFQAAGQAGAGFLPMLEQLTAGIAGFVNSAAGATALNQLFSGLSAAMAGLVPAVLQVVGALAVALGPVVAQLGPAVGQLALQIGTVLVTAIQILAPIVQQLAGFLAANASWIGPLAIGLTTLAVTIGPLIGFITRLVQVIKIVTLVFNVLRVALLTNPFVALAAAVIAIAVLIYSNWGAIKNFLISAWNTIKNTAVAVWNAIAGFFASIGKTIWGAIRDAWNSVVNTVRDFGQRFLAFHRQLPGMVLSALGNLGSLLVGAGRDLIMGLIRGVRSMIGNLLGTVRDMAASAVNTVKSWLGIASPSKVFAEIGRNTGQGFAAGIRKSTPEAIAAAQRMADQAIPTVRRPELAASAATGANSTASQVQAGVLAALDGARMQVEGDGLARLVNKTNASNARRS